MTSVPLNLWRSDTPAQIQENLIAYMRLFAELPGVVTHDAESFWMVSNLPAPGNAVLRARWPHERVEERIDALFEQIGEHIDTIDWMVFPGDQPDDLGKRLEARGMPPTRGGNWLWADLNALLPAPAMPDTFRIVQVRDDQHMAEWVRVSEAGFGGELALFYDAYARHGYGPAAHSLHYIAYMGETPVASGTVLVSGGCAAIYDLSTPPAFRRQGVGAALTHTLMREIRNRGYADTWIWSSNMAKSVYQRLGYIDVDFGMREHSWHKS